jgi:hypothetical protein
MYERFRAQSARVSPQDVVAKFQNLAIAAAAEEERRFANVRLGSLVLLVQCQCGLARCQVRLHDFLGPIAGRLPLRVTQLQQDFCGPHALGGVQIRILGQNFGRSIMSDGLGIGAALFRKITGRDPMGERGAEIPGLLIMIGEQLRLGRADKTVVEFLQCRCDTLVIDLTPAPEQTCVSHIAGESVVKSIHGIRRRAAANGQS